MELKLPPPLVFLCCAAIIYFLPSYTEPNAVYHAFAFVFVALALLLEISASWVFLKHKTTVNPLKPNHATTLVTQGIYRLTRNPMYLSLAFLLIAWSLWLGNAFAFLVVWGFVAYITRFQIVPEERALQEKFGEKYQAYCQKVARWLL